MNISDEAVEAATQALRHAFDYGVDGFRDQARAALEAAAPHLMTKTEWGIFRASDPDTGTPIENLTYKTRKGAELARTTQYLQPEFWEVRGRPVGAWDRSAGAGE